MIELEVQIQLLVFSFLAGIIFAGIYSVFNFIMYRCNKFIRFLFEAPLFIIFTVIYFYLNYRIGEGILNIYYLLFLALGIFVYQKFYASSFLKLCSKIKRYLKKTIFDKLYLRFKKIHDIIKKKRKRSKKHGKIRKSTPDSLEQKSGDHHSFAWDFPPSSSVHD